MKAVIKVSDMKKLEDVVKVRQAISSNLGVLACQINQEKGEAEIIFDDSLSKVDEIIDSIENNGYIVL